MRLEYKYLVPVEAIPFLREQIRPHVIMDDHIGIGNRDDYTVRSIYFDTFSLDEYHKKLDGNRNRRKFRIRGYDQYDANNTVFLEIKHKHDLSVNKDRAPVRYGDLKRLLVEGDVEELVQIRPDFPNSIQKARKFLYHYFNRQLQPIVTVIYEREAYLYKFDHSGRITFDKNLRSVIYPRIDGLYSEVHVVNSFQRNFILEVKSNYGFPRWMVPVIGELGIRRQALSKYTISIDSHHRGHRKILDTEVISRADNPFLSYTKLEG